MISRDQSEGAQKDSSSLESASIQRPEFPLTNQVLSPEVLDNLKERISYIVRTQFSRVEALPICGQVDPDKNDGYGDKKISFSVRGSNVVAKLVEDQTPSANSDFSYSTRYELVLYKDGTMSYLGTPNIAYYDSTNSCGEVLYDTSNIPMQNWVESPLEHVDEKLTYFEDILETLERQIAYSSIKDLHVLDQIDKLKQPGGFTISAGVASVAKFLIGNLHESDSALDYEAIPFQTDSVKIHRKKDCGRSCTSQSLAVYINKGVDADIVKIGLVNMGLNAITYEDVPELLASNPPLLEDGTPIKIVTTDPRSFYRD